jgi:hypothetical protein
MHLLIILVLAIWIGLALSKMGKRDSLKLVRAIGILALVVIGLLVFLTLVGYAVNIMFAICLGFAVSAIGVIGGLVWLVQWSSKAVKE